MHRDIEALKSDHFDLLVIGGGVHGACAARDAALRGLKVALIDKADLCGATSHNSLKTIHGGIRYLQHLNIKRTLESIKEQAIWLRTAPHLVKPLKFLMPTYGYGTRGPIFMWLGIRMFELLGIGRNRHIRNDRKLSRGTILNVEACVKSAPNIPADNLTGGAIWCDAQVEYADKAVLQICQHAHSNKAIIANYIQANKLTLDGSKVSGLEVEDMLSGDSFTIKTNCVLNAAGPWAAELLKSTEIQSSSQTSLPLTKSINLVSKRLAPEYAISAQSKIQSDSKIDSSKRLYFIVPWQQQAMFGTTHFPYDKSVDEMRYNNQEVEDFIVEINFAFPGYNLSINDVTYCYQGLTPAEQDKKEKSVRAHHSKVIDHTEDNIEGLISIISIKWTTARLVAERAIDVVMKKLNRSGGCQTRFESIPDNSNITDKFSQLDEAQLADAVKLHVQNTMTVSLLDLLTRRTNDFVQGKLSAEQIKILGRTLANELCWDDQTQQSELEKLLAVWMPCETRQELMLKTFWDKA